jgi:phosphate transport system permease protein
MSIEREPEPSSPPTAPSTQMAATPLHAPAIVNFVAAAEPVAQDGPPSPIRQYLSKRGNGGLADKTFAAAMLVVRAEHLRDCAVHPDDFDCAFQAEPGAVRVWVLPALGVGPGVGGLWRTAVHLRNAGHVASGAGDGGAAGAGRRDLSLRALPGRGCGLPISFLTELLAAIPSVVYGLWAVFVLVPIMRDQLGPLLYKTLGWTGFFEGTTSAWGC